MHATCSDSWVFVHVDMLLIDDYLWECFCPVELATRCPLPIQTSVEKFGLPFRSVVETTGDVTLGAELPTNPQYIDIFQSISTFANPSLDEQWVWHGVPGVKVNSVLLTSVSITWFYSLLHLANWCIWTWSRCSAQPMWWWWAGAPHCLL